MTTYIENLDADIGLTEGNIEELSGTSDEYIKSRIDEMSRFYIRIHAPWYEGTPEYHQVYYEVYSALMNDYKSNS
jgi:hypothetical protein